jgi:hypothetical protein
MFPTNDQLLLGLYKARCDLVRLKHDLHGARLKEVEILTELERRGMYDVDIEEETRAALVKQHVRDQISPSA